MAAKLTRVRRWIATVRQSAAAPSDRPAPVSTMTWPPPWLQAPAGPAAERHASQAVAWPPPWVEVHERRAAERRLGPRAAWSLLELAEESPAALADEPEQPARPAPRERGRPDESPAAAGATNRLLVDEELAIVELIEQWSAIDHSYRRLAHRGSYLGSVFVSPSTVQRIALKHGLAVPGDPPRPPRRKLSFPEVPWEPNRLWMWEASPFPSAGRLVYAIVDLVSRYWLGYLLSDEHTSAQVRELFASALEQQGLGENGERDPILVAWPESGSSTSAAGAATATATVESLFGQLMGDYPQLSLPSDPETLDHELARIRDEYNQVRLHAAIGYVTPADAHQGRAAQIGEAREAGLKRARAQRIARNRST